jgi:DNA-3-methyladenine glycosylase II
MSPVLPGQYRLILEPAGIIINHGGRNVEISGPCAREDSARDTSAGTILRFKGMKQLYLSLVPIPPFRLDLTAWALRRRPDNAVDRWAGRTYRRVVVAGNLPLQLSVTQQGSPAEAELRITVTGEHLLPATESTVAAWLERVLGVKTDMTAFYTFAASDDRLHSLVQRFRGFKPPRFFSLFEALINGIACQQLTLTFGIRLLNRLAAAYGAAFPDRSGTVHALPRPEALAGLPTEALRALSFSTQKARALIELSGDITGGRFNPDEIELLDDESALARLQKLRGVGRWTAEYALLRGLGRLHVFPADDVGGRNNLARFLGITHPLDRDGALRILDAWKPYGGLIYLHLLLDHLARCGHLPESPD